MSTAVLQPIATFAPTRPVEVVPNVHQVSRGRATICSIWPQNLRAQRKHNGLTLYEMPAAPRGSYVTYTVYDTQQWINRPRDDRFQGDVEPMPIPARIVAEDLVSTWGGDTLGARSGYRPGIAVIAGEVPTPEELAAIRAGQSNLFNWLITDANGKHMSGEGVLISDMHRMAAKEMLDKGADRLPWFPVVEFSEVKDCPACGKQTETKAKVCDKCQMNLVDWYLKYNLNLDADPVIKAFVEQNNLRPDLKSAESTPTDPRAAGQPRIVKA